MAAAGNGQWNVEIAESWASWFGPHGGVIAGMAVEVAEMEASGANVRSMDLRFLGKPRIGQMQLFTSIYEVGRTTRVIDIAFVQDQTVASASVTLGRIGPASNLDRPGLSQANVRPPNECDLWELPLEILPVGTHLEIRPTDGPLPGSGSEEARMRAWLSTRPKMSINAAVLAVLADALPPAIFTTMTEPVATPTVSMSMYITADLRQHDLHEVLGHTWNVHTGGGWSVDDTELRDGAGQLLATARQSRRILLPRD
ncbi:acyl-CoA thioesterase domain-containing protein [Rhodococcus sp. NPDC057014]|uniref:acyl-CoA thioesterase domain-containing protein n=1 Tax=Rhodococcus sp. NPDC057014 TaxID=3346000 RepID=UPI0036253079